jgi:hypothetical protein
MSTDVSGLFSGHRSIETDKRKENRHKERGSAEELCLQQRKWRMARDIKDTT